MSNEELAKKIAYAVVDQYDLCTFHEHGNSGEYSPVHWDKEEQARAIAPTIAFILTEQEAIRKENTGRIISQPNAAIELRVVEIPERIKKRINIPFASASQVKP